MIAFHSRLTSLSPVRRETAAVCRLAVSSAAPPPAQCRAEPVNSDLRTYCYWCASTLQRPWASRLHHAATIVHMPLPHCMMMTEYSSCGGAQLQEAAAPLHI